MKITSQVTYHYKYTLDYSPIILTEQMLDAIKAHVRLMGISVYISVNKNILTIETNSHQVFNWVEIENIIYRLSPNYKAPQWKGVFKTLF